MNVTLPPEQESLVRDLVAAGHFRSESEVVSEALDVWQGQFESLKREIELGLRDDEEGRLVPAERVFQELREIIEKHRRP